MSSYRVAYKLMVVGLMLVLAGCSSAPRKEFARYDFGDTRAVVAAEAASGAPIEVSAVSWLSATDMHYRLLYAEPQRRRTFTGSRWAAPPADLLARALRRQSVAVAGGGCRVHLVLDELEQRYESAGAGFMQLDVHAAVMPQRGETVLARKLFSLREAATAPDAAAGAAAMIPLLSQLSGVISEWLGTLPSKAVCQR